MSTAALLTRSSRELREAVAPFADERRVAAAKRRTELEMAGRDLTSVTSTPASGWFASERDTGHVWEQRSNGQIVEIVPMLVATRSFTADYDGEQIRIGKDERVAVGHAIAPQE